jgi:subtilase family serine protease
MRVAYGVDTLIAQGFTGKGQTVVVIDAFGSPALQQDMDAFNSYYHLPSTTVQVLSPLGNPAFDPTNKDMVAWAEETEEDVETVHALAPGAQIVLYVSPVTWTEGTTGMPDFLTLEQDAVQTYPGSPVSQSWDTSEATLADPASRAVVQRWDDFFHTATTQDGMTYFAGSGDYGASNVQDVGGTRLASQPTSGFPADDPWVTGVGGTTLTMQGTVPEETAWRFSGGGISALYTTPSYQRGLPAYVQTVLQGKRGIPDVAASADIHDGLGIYVMGQWKVSLGTSAGAPVWSALTAILNQKAGRALGFLNPLLYQLAASPTYAQDFHDIIAGNNDVNAAGVHVTGYSAGAGWDAVTGLGTPAAHLIPDLVSASAVSS